MTVNPGFGGQLHRTVMPKVEALRTLAGRGLHDLQIQVDGGIIATHKARGRADDSSRFRRFKAPSLEEGITELRDLAAEVWASKV